jgi:hypothetical protein
MFSEEVLFQEHADLANEHIPGEGFPAQMMPGEVSAKVALRISTIDR